MAKERTTIGARILGVTAARDAVALVLSSCWARIDTRTKTIERPYKITSAATSRV